MVDSDAVNVVVVVDERLLGTVGPLELALRVPREIDIVNSVILVAPVSDHYDPSNQHSPEFGLHFLLVAKPANFHPEM